MQQITVYVAMHHIRAGYSSDRTHTQFGDVFLDEEKANEYKEVTEKVDGVRTVIDTYIRYIPDQKPIAPKTLLVDEGIIGKLTLSDILINVVWSAMLLISLYIFIQGQFHG